VETELEDLLRRVVREEFLRVKQVDFTGKLLGTGAVFWCEKLGAVVLNAVGLGNHMVVLVSYDRGETRREVFRDARDLGSRRGGYVTRNGVVLLSAGTALYRSEDLEVFERVYESAALGVTRWFVEMGDGSLYAVEMFDVAPKIRFIKSVDGGKTWASTGGSIDDDHVHQMVWDRWRDRGLIVTGDTAHGVWATTDFVTITKLTTLNRPTPIGVLPFEKGMLLLCENNRVYVAPTDAAWVKPIATLARHWGTLSGDGLIPPLDAPWTYVTYGLFRVGPLVLVPGWDAGFLWFSREGREWNRVNLRGSVQWIDGDDRFVYASGGRWFSRVPQALLWTMPQLTPSIDMLELLWFYELRDTAEHWTDNFEAWDYEKCIIFVSNELNQAVTVEVEADPLAPTFVRKVVAVSAFDVAAGAKAYRVLDAPFPFVRVKYRAAVAPTSGSLFIGAVGVKAPRRG